MQAQPSPCPVPPPTAPVSVAVPIPSRAACGAKGINPLQTAKMFLHQTFLSTLGSRKMPHQWLIDGYRISEGGATTSPRPWRPEWLCRVRWGAVDLKGRIRSCSPCLPAHLLESKVKAFNGAEFASSGDAPLRVPRGLQAKELAGEREERGQWRLPGEDFWPVPQAPCCWDNSRSVALTVHQGCRLHRATHQN